MRKIHLSTLAIAIAASLTISGCKKDDSTASDAQVTFAMQSDNASMNFVLAAKIPGLPVPLATTTTTLGTASVLWTSAIANVSKFKLDAKKNGTAFEVVANGLTNVDLLSTAPITTNSTIGVGTYTGVEIHVVLAASTGTAYPLVLKGTYTTKAGTAVPIEFDFNESLEIVATAADLTIDGTTNLATSLSLHLNKLLADVTTTDIDQTTRSTIGNVTNNILITSAINPTVYAKIKADLAGAGGSNVTTVKK